MVVVTHLVVTEDAVVVLVVVMGAMVEVIEEAMEEVIEKHVSGILQNKRNYGLLFYRS